MGMGRVVEGQGKSCRRTKGERKRGMGTTAEGQGDSGRGTRGKLPGCAKLTKTFPTV